MTSIAHAAKALQEKEDAPNTLALATTDGNTELVTSAAEVIDADAKQGWRGINIGGDTVTRATEKLPTHEKTLIRWLHDRARNKEWTWVKLEAETGISKTVAFRVFRGEYSYPTILKQKREVNGVITIVNVRHPKAGQPISLDGVCEKIERCKRNVEKEQALFSVGFLKTSVWERIEWACMKALEKNRIVFVYGEGQIGKTTCGEEFAAQHNGGQTSFIRIPPSGGVQSLLKAIARALHVSSNRPADVLLEDVLRALDKSKLLIFDEVHEIFIAYTKSSVIRCMELLRYIFDKTHCGMVLFGTAVFKDRLKEGEFFQFLKQLHRRGLYEVQLPDVTPREDLELALRSYGLEWPIEAKLEQEIEHLAVDGFGQVLTRLEDGKGVADKAGHPYTWADFVKARNIVRKMTMKPGTEGR